ncbi:MAG: aquaporin [Armatimonadetes bacterium]|nr:aquaporin [Armatimonadota bacterium]MDE2207951.1 aquaporin [Armatimonadota bacterium]
MTAAMARRYAAEMAGTFGIVFAPASLAGSSHLAGGAPGLLAAACASGLAVSAMIYALGHISAAHFNPAVTLGFAVAGRFPWRYVPGYWAAQFAGAIAGGAFAVWLFGAGSGVQVPAAGPVLRNVALEAAITFQLMLVIISVATDRRVNGAVPGLAIGFAVIVGVLIGGPVTGGSMNPARSLGPALFAGGAAIAHLWIYFAGPAAGAVLAARTYELLRGGEHHAQGAPNDLFVALQSIRSEA